MSFNALQEFEKLPTIPLTTIPPEMEPEKSWIAKLLELSESGKPTDNAIATCWLIYTNYDFVYNNTKGKWYYYSAGYWIVDGTNMHKRSILDMAGQLKRYANSAQSLEDKEMIQKLANHLENTRNWGGVLGAASVLQCKVDNDFNSNIDLINLKNGTLDLSSMSFRAHNKNDYLTHLLDYEYNPNAVCNRWNQFLSEIFSADTELIRFVQKSVGYSLTGLSKENHFFFLYGTGANGKSVFINIIESLFGSYFVKIPLSMLTVNKNSSDSLREVPRLIGKRFAVSNEVDEGGRLSESMIKDLSGNDTLSGRRLYEETITFKPTHTLWIYGNHKPLIKGTDSGIWRRPLLIPFTVTIPENKRDLNLANKLESELPGILNWALEGLKMWEAETLKPIPAGICAATNEYKNDMDLVGQFLQDCTVHSSSSMCYSIDLFRRFQSWQKDNGDTSTVRSNWLTIRLQERGMVKQQGSANKSYWPNLEIVWN